MLYIHCTHRNVLRGKLVQTKLRRCMCVLNIIFHKRTDGHMISVDVAYMCIWVSNSWKHEAAWHGSSLALCESNPLVNGGFPLNGAVTRNFDISFVCLSNLSSKQSSCRLFETPWRSYDVAVTNLNRNMTSVTSMLFARLCRVSRRASSFLIRIPSGFHFLPHCEKSI